MTPDTVAIENTSQSKQFKVLLEQVRHEVDALKQNVADLERRNTKLKKKLQEAEKREADVFSSMSDPQRITLKHQVEGLISKIDNHLGES